MMRIHFVKLKFGSKIKRNLQICHERRNLKEGSRLVALAVVYTSCVPRSQRVLAPERQTDDTQPTGSTHTGHFSRDGQFQHFNCSLSHTVF